MTTHTAHADTAHHAAVGHHSHRPLYLKIFAALMVLLVLTVVAAKFQIPGSGNIIVALVIAIIKAALIVMFFMHFRDSDHLTWLVGAATVAFFLILIFMTFQDYVSRDWITTMPGK
jgi:cytochrome c oxidase subunit IV